MAISILIDGTQLSNNQAGTVRRKLETFPDVAYVNGECAAGRGRWRCCLRNRGIRCFRDRNLSVTRTFRARECCGWFHLAGIGGAVFVWAQIADWRSGPQYSDRALTWPSDICNGSSSNGSSSYRGSPMPLDDIGEPWPAATEPCRLLVRNSVLRNNTAVSGWGGGIMLASCAARAVNSTFANNTAGIPGGGLALLEYEVPSSGYDPLGPCVDGVPLFGTGVSPKLLNGSSNSSGSSGTSSGSGSGSGSSRHLLQQSALQLPQVAVPRWLVLDNVTMEGNSATEGGGLYLEVNRTAALLKRCLFTSNTASNVGG